MIVDRWTVERFRGIEGPRTIQLDPHRINILSGPNGCGKSTLLRLLTGVEEADRGEVIWPGGTSFADFNQILAEQDPGDTVTHAVNTMGGPGSLAFGAQRKQVNKFLGLLQFSEMDLNQRIGTLSGGQRARVALAKCLLSGAQTLVLDEPTNHLDLTSTQVTERLSPGRCAFDGNGRRLSVSPCFLCHARPAGVKTCGGMLFTSPHPDL